MNLCLNARDAMPHGGVLRVSASVVTPGSPALPRNLQFRSAVPCPLFEDTGTGMDEATRARVFEPFFTTKRDGAGFGLGLATVKEVVAFTVVKSRLRARRAKARRFLVFLPLHRAERETGKITAAHGPPSSGSRGVILLVDDEEVVRRSFARLLRQAGHQVGSAGRRARHRSLHAHDTTPKPRHPGLGYASLDRRGNTGAPARRGPVGPHSVRLGSRRAHARERGACPRRARFLCASPATRRCSWAPSPTPSVAPGGSVSTRSGRVDLSAGPGPVCSGHGRFRPERRGSIRSGGRK